MNQRPARPRSRPVPANDTLAAAVAAPDAPTPTRRSRRSILAKAAAGATVLVGAALHPSPAFAHNVFETYTVWDDGSVCTKLYAEISDGNGNGYVRSKTYAYVYPGPDPIGSGCNTVQSRPTNFIRSRWTLVKKSGPGVFDMSACLGPDFGGNDPFYAYSERDTTSWGSHYWVPGGAGDTPPCGYGSYSNTAEGGVRYGDSWHSGAAFPGWHDFLQPK